MNRTDFRAALSDDNVQAFLRVIREGESSQDSTAYRMVFGGETFDSFADHPQRLVTRGLGGQQITSSAAGAYQFLSRTWDNLVAQYGFPDFTPASQDEAAVALIAERKALDDVRAGRFDDAVRKVASVWASLPTSPYNQPRISWDRARAVYEKWGGRYEGELVKDAPPPAEPIGTPQDAPAPAAPVDDTATQPYDDLYGPDYGPRGSTMPAPILATVAASIVPELLKVLPWYAKSDAAQRNVAAVQAIAPSVIAAAQQASAERGLAEAAQAVLDKPDVQKRFVATMATRWGDLAPMLEYEAKERAAARSFGAAMTSQGPGWRQVGFGVTIAVLALVIILGGGTMFYQFMHSDTVTSEQKAMILGALIASFTTVVGYFFGSSASSRAKDVTLAERR